MTSLLRRARPPQSPPSARPLLPTQGTPARTSAAPTSAPGSRHHLGTGTRLADDIQSGLDVCEPFLLPDVVQSMAKRECDKTLAPDMKKKQKTDDLSSPPLGNAQSGPLACPFFLAAPEQFKSRRTCAGHSWNGIPRLKEHLYRCHDSSRLSCERCLLTFADDKELVAHRRRPEPCPRTEINVGDTMLLSIGPTAMNRIRSRRGTAGKPERDKWFEIWDILFPDLPRPESPYVSPTNCPHAPEAKVIADIRPHLEDQLIGAFRTAIKNAMADDTQLTSVDIERVVSKCVDQAFRRYLGEASPYHGQTQRRLSAPVSELSAGSSARGRMEASPVWDWYHVPSPATSNDAPAQLDTFPYTPTPELLSSRDEDGLSHSTGSLTSAGIAFSDGAPTPTGDFGLAELVRIQAAGSSSIPWELPPPPRCCGGFDSQHRRPLDWPMELPAETFAFMGDLNADAGYLDHVSGSTGLSVQY